MDDKELGLIGLGIVIAIVSVSSVIKHTRAYKKKIKALDEIDGEGVEERKLEALKEKKWALLMVAFGDAFVIAIIIYLMMVK